MKVQEYYTTYIIKKEDFNLDWFNKWFDEFFGVKYFTYIITHLSNHDLGDIQIDVYKKIDLSKLH